MANGSSFPLAVRPALIAHVRTRSRGRGERARLHAPRNPVGIVLTLLLALTLALQTAAPVSAKPGSGNSPSAKLCQKGGYATLATSEDPHTAFATEEACVSYAAKGGQLKPLLVASLTLATNNVPGNIVADVIGSGLLPGSPAFVSLWDGGTLVQIMSFFSVRSDGMIQLGFSVGECQAGIDGVSISATRADGATLTTQVSPFQCSSYLP